MAIMYKYFVACSLVIRLLFLPGKTPSGSRVTKRNAICSEEHPSLDGRHESKLNNRNRGPLVTSLLLLLFIII